jgi:hypothetical protein
LVTDFSIEWAGWLIDDIGIGAADFYGYSYKSGTSMATPHVTGAVALLAAQFPSETTSERINKILNNVKPLPSLVGTCVTEGMLNLYQAVCLPGVPENPLPLDNAADISVNTILDWDDCPGASSYDIYFGTSYPPPLAAAGAASHYDPGTLASHSTYHWKVVAKSACGDTSGPEWSFTTGSGVIQYTLTVASTLGGTTNPSPGDYVYDSGTPVLVAAISGNGYDFSHWTGGIPSGHEADNPISITVDSNKSVTANFVSQAPAISSLILNASDFLPQKDDNDFQLTDDSFYAESGSSFRDFFAPVHLPQNACVKSLVIYYYDNDDQGEIEVKLTKCNAYNGMATNMADWMSSGLLDSMQIHKITSITGDGMINNRAYLYFVHVFFTDGGGASNVMISGIKITYTLE